METNLCDCPYRNALLLKEGIRSLWDEILSFKSSTDFEKGRNWRESPLVPVVSPWCAYFFQRSGYAIVIAFDLNIRRGQII